MKHMVRGRGEEAEADKFNGSVSKDLTNGLIKAVCFLVIFVAGVVLGLSASAHVSRYLNSQTEAELFFPTNRYAAIPDKECEKEDRLSIKNFFNPGQLTHEMTDEELFWRASVIPKKEEYPYKRVPKVAFMFLTRGPLPLSPLWDRFFHGHEGLYSIYVHALPGYKLNVSNTSAFYDRQIPSRDVQWGSISLADAERRLLANALLDFSNERFVLLSESCIPVYDFPTVYNYLTSSAQSFVESYDDPTRDGRGRYSRSMLPDIKLFQWRKGSQWFELNRSLAINIISDTKYYTLFKKYCRPSCYPDEHYLPTFLNMFFGALNSNRTVTWVDWSRGGPHPATLGAVNITEDFIQSIRENGTGCWYNSRQISTCFLFARKFAPSALEPLLNLTSTVMKF
ncbi:glycosyltransferase BC10-like [Tasmannia lanceolata]|uniref:glycosyltransferase BC10-like n=1 Tax=Tasmannia lanceolata TaxID=3420 RepID=UPI0040630AB2